MDIEQFEVTVTLDEVRDKKLYDHFRNFDPNERGEWALLFLEMPLLVSGKFSPWTREAQNHIDEYESPTLH